jgi:hypothetical protein
VVTRKNEDRTVWFVLNTSDRTIETEVDSGGELGEIALDPALPVSLRKEDGKYRRTIRPFESFMLVNRYLNRPQISLPVVRIPVGGPYNIKPMNPNVLRLGDWQMSLRNEKGHLSRSAWVRPMPMVDQLRHGHFEFHPHIMPFFGYEAEMTVPAKLPIRYECEFENHYDGAVELVIEPNSISGNWQIFINDSAPITADQFKLTETHVRGSRGLDITSRCRSGPNTIWVDLAASKSDDGLLNALYLAGNFGVALDPVRLVSPVQTGLFEEYEHNQLPFFSGIIEYRTMVNLEAVLPNREIAAELDFGKTIREACEVSINGGDWIPLLWEPRYIVLSPSRLKPGKNEFRVKVYTTRLRTFEGKRFDDADREMKRI